MRILLFDALLLATCGYAFWRGGRPERITALAFAAGYLATLARYSPLAIRFAHVELCVMLVDLALLIILVAVALRYDRGWPMALAALQFDTVCVHVARILDCDIIRLTYALLLAMWSYPMLAILLLGTWRHHRREIRDRKTGTDH